MNILLRNEVCKTIIKNKTDNKNETARTADVERGGAERATNMF